jgi:DNA-binding transcriptional regulator GbsR (MarR family)
MELESMFSQQKWNILKCLSYESLSPIQLAEKLNTTMANISTQLRLLEASNLVKKQKIKNRDKGKPRTLFSLACDNAYLIFTMNNYANKKLINLDNHQKTILKIWFIENQNLGLALERLYWKLESSINKISAIGIKTKSSEVFIITDNKDEIKSLVRDEKIYIKLYGNKEAHKISSSNEDIFLIYDKDNKFKPKTAG